MAEKVPPLVTFGLGALMTLEGSQSRHDSLVSGSESLRVQHSLETNANSGEWGAVAVGF